MSLRDPFMPRSRSSVSPPPGRPEHGPHSGIAERSGEKQVAPGRTPKLARPRSDPRPGWPWGPGRGILQPGYRRAGQSTPRSHFPRELPVCVGTPMHTRRDQHRIPCQPCRPVRLRVSPGSVPCPSRAGKLFSPPVAEWSREQHRHLAAPRTGTGLCRRRGEDPGPLGTAGTAGSRCCPRLGAQPGPRDAAFSFPSSSETTEETAIGSELRHRYRTVPPGLLPGSAGVSGPRTGDPGCAHAAATPTVQKTPEIPVQVFVSSV